MTGKKSIWIKILLLITVVLSLTGCQEMMLGMLGSKGIVTFEQRRLFFDSLALMMIVVIPVFIMSIAFSIRYRANNHVSEYKPQWGHSVLLESIWWGVPCAIIIVLGIMTWISSHKLDPYRKIDAPGKPMLVQAIALPWKYLFIYPEQNIATVNYLALAKGQQVEFWLTNDNVPMSAIFVPKLGSQIYSMAGMRTRLHLLAYETGLMEGLNTQYNGDGFSDMKFKVDVMQPEQLKQWIAQVKQAKQKLSAERYSKLKQPTINNKAEYFSAVMPSLFTKTIDKYKQTGDTFSY